MNNEWVKLTPADRCEIFKKHHLDHVSEKVAKVIVDIEAKLEEKNKDLDEPTDDEIDSWVLDDKYSTRDFIEHFEAIEKEKRTEPLCSYCKKPLGPNDRVHVCKNRGKP